MLNFKKASKHAQNAEMHPLFLSEKTSEMLNFKKAAKIQNMHKMQNCTLSFFQKKRKKC
jgi:hypothetical protein